MNKVFMNTVSLAKDPFIRKDEGGGGSATIKNQDKSLEIVENGTTEVTADAGFTGLGKVTINTNVPTSCGGGGGSDMPVIGDGKTYLYITIADKAGVDLSLFFQQSVAQGVTIDWGDGSAPWSVYGTGNVNTTHKYAAVGDYVISLNPADGCTLGLGYDSSSYCVMGRTTGTGLVYTNALKAVEIGKNVPSIGAWAFAKCSSLASIVIPEGVTSIGTRAFNECYSLASIVIPNSVTSIGQQAFYTCSSLASIVIPDGVTSIVGDLFTNCYSLASIVIPEGVTSIGNSAFSRCYSLASIVIPNSVTSIESYAFGTCTGIFFLDFSQHTSIPTIGNSILSGTTGNQIIVPDALYDEWIAATNWSTYAGRTIKKSDWDASQS